jgi:hypothetical protein
MHHQDLAEHQPEAAEQPVDLCDIGIRSPQCSGRSNTGKTTANDNDPLLLWLRRNPFLVF